jgi:NADH-quinone oxidoreductase subunit E
MDDGKIDQIIESRRGDASALIQVLLEIQRENRWLPRTVLKKVSEGLDVPYSRVIHTASFHKAFRLVPEGRHEVHVCDGTSCHVRGSQRVLGAVQDLTGLREGDTDPDMKFTVKVGVCMGRCAQGPVMVVDGKHHGHVEPAMVEGVLKDCD